ncbi:YheV family putative zinc ribbon protein [Edwardsiella tarda]|uniref:YheV family putative zinc ribbon protein n=1 Tax=Edwardsiella tarda TaxID=636 RepID=UPI00098F6685|nr:YheV family putative zinc ribbon protein [Edwardsiella tarda]
MKRRFIAGARCPACHAMDSLALWRDVQGEQVQCVRCGHRLASPTSPSEDPLASEQLIGRFKP